MSFQKLTDINLTASQKIFLLIVSSIIVQSVPRHYAIFQFHSNFTATTSPVPPCIINAFQFRPPVNDEIKQSRPVSVRAAADKW